MPAGLFDESDGGGVPTPPGNVPPTGFDPTNPASFMNPEDKAKQMRDVFAQIMAAQQGISPPGAGPGLQDENLWAAQGQAQMGPGSGAPQSGTGMGNFPAANVGGQPSGLSVPSMQAQPPAPDLSFPTATPAGGNFTLPPFPKGQNVTLGGEGGGGPGGGAYGLPQSPRTGRR